MSVEREKKCPNVNCENETEKESSLFSTYKWKLTFDKISILKNSKETLTFNKRQIYK